MIIKSNNRFLDFNDDIEMERICKLFEDMDSATGDFSYRFEIQFTNNNDEILTLPFADVSSKKVYKQLDCELLDNEGETLYTGFLRVEKVNYEKKVYECSFFSGNTNWLNKLTGKVSDAGFDDYAVEINRLNIQNSWTKTSGTVFRFFDSGNLITRSHGKTVLEDWAPMIFVKDVFFKIFNSHSIKIQGELLNDWTFNNMLVCSNTHSNEEVDNRTVFVRKVGTQHIPTAPAIITFQDDSTYPYYNSPSNNWDLPNNQYVSDSKTILRLDINLTYITVGAILSIVKNGIYGGSIGNATGGTASFVRYISVDPGDTIQIGVKSSFGSIDIMTFTLKVTPLFLYNVLGENIVPKWTQQQFVTNILSLFNVVSDYDPHSSTVTFNFFDNIKSKANKPIPITVQTQNVDYVEFVGNFAKNNYFSYQEGPDDNLKEYNVTHFIKYGQGNIPVDNDYLQLSTDVIQSDFTAPLSYINRQFGSLSLERTTIFESEDADTQDTTVTNNAGVAHFAITFDFIEVGNVVKIEMDNVKEYNGEWVVSHVGAGYFEVSDIAYIADDTGKITLQITKTTSNDNVYVFLDAGAMNYIDISTFSLLYIANFAFTQPGYCYFSLININKPVNALFGQSLSFGVNEENSDRESINQQYQRSLLDTYWQSFKRILNDPAKMYMKGYLSKKTFKDITPLNPVFIETEESSNQYYVNRITGYKNSYTECTMELIKL